MEKISKPSNQAVNTQTVASLFRKQVKEIPENIAVVYKDKKYTYAEVDELSDRLAAFVASKGLGKEDVVSILIPRCEWMVIAPLGVLKGRLRLSASRSYLSQGAFELYGAGRQCQAVDCR